MNAPETIQTDRLVLRCYRSEDAQVIFECYAQDEEVTRFLTWRPHRNIETTISFVKERICAWEQGDDFTWAITTLHDILIGGIGLRIRDFKADFRYVIGRPYWSNGYASEALLAIVQWAIGQPSIHRIWGVCDVANNASSRVMEKCGLQSEGVLRKWIMHPQIGETPRDCLCYSITRDTISKQSTGVNPARPGVAQP